jgi:hypothetical protein
MKDPDWHHGPQDEDDDDTVEQWEIDEALADWAGDDEWVQEQANV